MERYDGKARKDDIRKWCLILIPIALCLLIWFLYIRHIADGPEPDLEILLIAGLSQEDKIGTLEAQFSSLVGDLNGDGEAYVKVHFGSVASLDSGGGLMDSSMVYFSEPDYDLFLMPSTTAAVYEEAEYFDEVYDLSGSALLQETGLLNFSGCIIDWASAGKGDPAGTEGARALVQMLQK